MKQAILPDHLEEIGIVDMVEGESGYIVPWAMFSDKNSRLWLNGNYTFSKESKGTSTLGVRKENGMFIVDISKCRDKKWLSSDHCFIGEFSQLPVSEIKGG